jgi:hypothetical protein
MNCLAKVPLYILLLGVSSWSTSR